MASSDTIAAIASAPGRGAVGVIRVSGPNVPQIAACMLGNLPPPRVAQLAHFIGSDGDSIDRGLALYFPAPASYTGEHVLELQGHGGVLVLDLLLKRLLELGCRMARPGEFSERAFLNGKIDIAQAEAIADLIDAGSTAAARAAMRSMQGEFSAHIHALQAQITELRTLVEAAIDFPDEELDFVPGSELGRRVAKIFSAFELITAAARQGALLREGLNVVIAGKPNAGKSSLLNRLVGDEVAIELGRADRVLYLLDAAARAGESSAATLAAELQELPRGVPVTLIFNKIDLSGAQASVDEARDPPQVFLSAKTGAGLDLLRAHLKSRAGYRSGESGALSARRRHLDALERARSSVAQAAQILTTSRAFELFAEELRRAQLALGEITGEFTSDDLLGEIFSSFCIGK